MAGQPSTIGRDSATPAKVQAGSGLRPTVSAEDSNGFVVPTFDDPIELSILTNPPGDGVLNGTNPLGALYGSAAYDDLTIDQAGIGYVLQASDLTPGTSVAAGVTNPFDVTAGPAVAVGVRAHGRACCDGGRGPEFRGRLAPWSSTPKTSSAASIPRTTAR